MSQNLQGKLTFVSSCVSFRDRGGSRAGFAVFVKMFRADCGPACKFFL